jgi:hypothetical protein
MIRKSRQIEVAHSLCLSNSEINGFSEYGHHVDSQFMHMVRYGTQLLIVDKADKFWQIYGIAQDVNRLLTVSC